MYPMFCPNCKKEVAELCPFCKLCFNCCGAHENYIPKPEFEKIVRDEDRVRKR